MENNPKKLDCGDVTLFFLGLFFLLCFFSLEKSNQGLGIHYYGAGVESRSELNLWLAYVLFLTPGFFLFIYPFRVSLTNKILKIKERIENLNHRERIFGVLFLAVVAFLMAKVGHDIILLGYPVTDDELGAKLGGQILSSGHVMAAIWEPFKSYMHPFMYVREGHYTSFESPGVLLVWALGDLLNADSFVWALVAAVPVIPIILIARRFFSPFWTFFSGILYLFSAQALTLSLTSHAHLLTRALLSLALLWFVIACERKDDFKAYWLFGLITGLGLISRPYEIGIFLVPFYLFLFWQGIKGNLKRIKVFAGIGLGVLAPALLFFWYNLLTTGSFFHFTREHPAYYDFIFPTYESLYNKINSASPVTLELIWKRFGGNLSNNLLGLWIWFYAPLGFFLACAGISTNTFTKLLGLGILSTFVLALFHDVYGVHLAGPVNYSECVVALALLAPFGTKNFYTGLKNMDLKSKELVCTIVFSLLVGSTVFISKNWLALRSQAEIHNTTYGFIAENVENFWKSRGSAGKAIILTKQYREYWWSVPPFKEVGSFVYEWQIPNPNLSERIIYLRDDPLEIADLRKTFSDRDFFRLVSLSQAPYLSLQFLPP